MNKIYCPKCKTKSIKVMYGCGDEKDFFTCENCRYEKKGESSNSPYDYQYDEQFLIPKKEESENNAEILTKCKKAITHAIKRYGIEIISGILGSTEIQINEYLKGGKATMYDKKKYRDFAVNYSNGLITMRIIAYEKFKELSKKMGTWSIARRIGCSPITLSKSKNVLKFISRCDNNIITLLNNLYKNDFSNKIKF